MLRYKDIVPGKYEEPRHDDGGRDGFETCAHRARSLEDDRNRPDRALAAGNDGNKPGVRAYAKTPLSFVPENLVPTIPVGLTVRRYPVEDRAPAAAGE